MKLPALKNGEVVALNGVSWTIRVDQKALIIDRVSISGDKPNEYIIKGKSVMADEAFWDKSESEKKRLNVNDRLSLQGGRLTFDGVEIDCSGRHILEFKGDAVSLGEGIAVGVTTRDDMSSDPSFIYLMYVDVGSKKAVFHEVVGKMSYLDFIFLAED